jgi:hypothetical protein
VHHRSLQAFVGPGEPPSVGVVQGHLVGPAVSVTRRRFARLRLVDGSHVVAPVLVQTMTDETTKELAVNLPGDADTVSAELFVDGIRFTIAVAALGRP